VRVGESRVKNVNWAGGAPPARERISKI
jgi:hypothetical protein